MVSPPYPTPLMLALAGLGRGGGGGGGRGGGGGHGGGSRGASGGHGGRIAPSGGGRVAPQAAAAAPSGHAPAGAAPAGHDGRFRDVVLFAWFGDDWWWWPGWVAYGEQAPILPSCTGPVVSFGASTKSTRIRVASDYAGLHFYKQLPMPAGPAGSPGLCAVITAAFAAANATQVVGPPDAGNGAPVGNTAHVQLAGNQSVALYAAQSGDEWITFFSVDGGAWAAAYEVIVDVTAGGIIDSGGGASTTTAAGALQGGASPSNKRNCVPVKVLKGSKVWESLLETGGTSYVYVNGMNVGPASAFDQSSLRALLALTRGVSSAGGKPGTQSGVAPHDYYLQRVGCVPVAQAAVSPHPAMSPSPPFSPSPVMVPHPKGSIGDPLDQASVGTSSVQQFSTLEAAAIAQAINQWAVTPKNFGSGYQIFEVSNVDVVPPVQAGSAWLQSLSGQYLLADTQAMAKAGATPPQPFQVEITYTPDQVAKDAAPGAAMALVAPLQAVTGSGGGGGTGGGAASPPAKPVWPWLVGGATAVGLIALAATTGGRKRKK